MQFEIVKEWLSLVQMSCLRLLFAYVCIHMLMVVWVTMHWPSGSLVFTWVHSRLVSRVTDVLFLLALILHLPATAYMLRKNCGRGYMARRSLSGLIFAVLRLTHAFLHRSFVELGSLYFPLKLLLVDDGRLSIPVYYTVLIIAAWYHLVCSKVANQWLGSTVLNIKTLSYWLLILMSLPMMVRVVHQHPLAYDGRQQSTEVLQHMQKNAGLLSQRHINHVHMKTFEKQAVASVCLDLLGRFR